MYHARVRTIRFSVQVAIQFFRSVTFPRQRPRDNRFQNFPIMS
jgi:hypothetical protein